MAKPNLPVESPHVQDLVDLLVIAQRRKWEREIAQIDRTIAALPDDEPVRIIPAGERLADINEAWQLWTVPERNRACRDLFKDVRMDMLTKSLEVFPRPEFRALFEARTQYVSSPKHLFTPDRTRVWIITSDGFRLTDLAVA